MSFNIPPGINPFTVVPIEVTKHLLSFCEGNLSSKISLVCKQFWQIERDESLWKVRTIRLLGDNLGGQFFETFRTWKGAYLNFQQMSKEGSVISPTEISCLESSRTGNFLNGKLDGEGTIAFIDGTMMLHGQCKVICSDGEVWEGTFEKNRLHGQGKITFPDGRIIEGIFKNNRLIHSCNIEDNEEMGDHFISDSEHEG